MITVKTMSTVSSLLNVAACVQAWDTVPASVKNGFNKTSLVDLFKYHQLPGRVLIPNGVKNGAPIKTLLPGHTIIVSLDM